MTIEEASLDIAKSFQDKYSELVQELASINEELAITAKKFKKAAGDGDHSENAAYSEAKDKLTKLNAQKSYLLEDLKSFQSVPAQIKYVPKTYIDVYSTFRLRREDTGTVETWRVYPGTISDMSRSIMSSECPIFQQLKNKESGSVIRTKNRMSGKFVEFTVLEVY